MSTPNGGGDARASPRFSLGRTVITRGAIAALTADDVAGALARHARGDWGDLDPADKAANERALESEGRLVSRYRASNETPFYIITEWDRSLTTVLLPSEY